MGRGLATGVLPVAGRGRARRRQQPGAGGRDEQLGQHQQPGGHAVARATNALTRCSSSRGLNGLMT